MHRSSPALLAPFLAVALAAGTTATALAQQKRVEVFPNHDTQPRYGQLIGRFGGFAEPFTVEVDAGGADFLAVPNLNCNGAISYSRPDVTLDYRAGPAPVRRLNVSVQSPSTAILLVRTPDGRWHCEQDFDLVGAAVVSIPEPQPGVYAFWAGLADGGAVEAILAVTENDLPAGLGLALPDQTGEAANGVLDLTGTATDGEVADFEVDAGGRTRIASFIGNCPGHYSLDTPALHIENAEGARLLIDVTADTDTTLAVLTPDGTLLCDDDTIASNPRVVIAAPQAGRYTVWPGTFSESDGTAARLQISRGLGFALDADNDALAGAVAVDEVPPGGFDERPIEVGGGNLIGIGDLDPDCAGFIDADLPTLHVDANAGEEFFIGVMSKRDTTLVVLTPTGDLLCNDDFEGLNPRVLVENASAGRYTAWVGTFSSGESTEAALIAVVRPPG